MVEVYYECNFTNSGTTLDVRLVGIGRAFEDAHSPASCSRGKVALKQPCSATMDDTSARSQIVLGFFLSLWLSFIPSVVSPLHVLVLLQP